MYGIGLFSKMNRITTKTLRYYDDIGLFEPAHVDVQTGYRYYSSDQLPKLNKILTLKQMGISIKDIKNILDGNVDLTSFLISKERQLELNLSQAEKQLSHFQSYLRRMKGEKIMTYDPVIKSLPKCIVASMRFRAKNYDEYFQRIPPMGAEMKRLGAICALPEYCFNLYHDGEYRDHDIDVEVCEAVVEIRQNSKMVNFKEIARVDKALCILHKGPYNTLREAYNFAYQWIADNGYTIAGHTRESYIDGIWNKDNEDDWLTEIQIPIEDTQN